MPPQTHSTSTTQGYVRAFDGLRGCAALAVFFYHYFYWGIPAPTTNNLHFALWKGAQAGWLGVVLFFVLSGFLITGVLLDRKDEVGAMRDFYMRRVRRIFPAYFVTLAVVVLLFSHPMPFVGLSALFLGNFSDFFGIAMLYPCLWSLCVEEHFYLIWPWLTRFFSFRNLEKICLLVCVGSPLLRTARFYFLWPDGFYTWFWLDGMAWGALLAIWMRSTKGAALEKRMAGVAVLSVLSSLLLLATGQLGRREVLGSALSPTLIASLSFCLVGWIAIRPRNLFSGLLSGSKIVRVGKWSYGFYLYHGFFLAPSVKLSVMIEQAVGPFSDFGVTLVRVGLGAAFSLLAAGLSFRFIEVPFLIPRETASAPTLVPLIPIKTKANFG